MFGMLNLMKIIVVIAILRFDFVRRGCARGLLDSMKFIADFSPADGPAGVISDLFPTLFSRLWLTLFNMDLHVFSHQQGVSKFRNDVILFPNFS